jgi:hypothetical protein
LGIFDSFLARIELLTDGKVMAIVVIDGKYVSMATRARTPHEALIISIQGVFSSIV